METIDLLWEWVKDPTKTIPTTDDEKSSVPAIEKIAAMFEINDYPYTKIENRFEILDIR